MGLDMYLERAPKVSGLTFKEMIDLNNKYEDSGDINKIPEKYRSLFHKRGEHISWLSVKEEVMYWRKANAIHNYFVQHCGGGVDECQVMKVSRKDIEKLVLYCDKIIKATTMVKSKIENGYTFNKDGTKKPLMEEGEMMDEAGTKVAKRLLPSQSGFFFGSTNYDQRYFQDIKDTYDALKPILDTFDFKKNYLIYQASW